nr:antigen 5 like allergen Cul n 1-like [Drosophila bipectinata]
MMFCSLLPKAVVLLLIIRAVRTLVTGEDFSKYCKIRNCPANKTHIACNTTNSWSPKCGKNPEIMPLPENVQKIILYIHNIYRDAVASGLIFRLPPAGRMLKLKWSPKLAEMAELMIKRCDLQAPKECHSTYEFENPSYHAIYNKFKKNQHKLQVLKSQLNTWYNEYKYVNLVSLVDGSSIDNKEIGHFLRMMVGPSNRVGCAMAREHRDGWTYQWLACLYSCPPRNQILLYEHAARPGDYCLTGTDSKFRNLCHESEPEHYCKLYPEKFTHLVDNSTAIYLKRMLHGIMPRTGGVWCRICGLCCEWVQWGVTTGDLVDKTATLLLGPEFSLDKLIKLPFLG